MKTIALIEKGKDGTYGIYTPDLESTIVGEGSSVSEAKKDFECSMSAVIAAYRDNGLELPMELKNIEFEYRFDIASLLNYFDFINVNKFAKWLGVNPSLLHHYKVGDTYISAQRTKDIETAIHNIADELKSINLLG